MIDSPPLKVAVASGKGGTGKTLVATNLFQALLNAGMTVNLVDCDAEAPNARLFLNGTWQNSVEVFRKVPRIDLSRCTFCGRCQEYCNFHAVFMLQELQTIQIMEEFCHSCGACAVACRNGAITEKEVAVGRINMMTVQQQSRVIESSMYPGQFSPVHVIKRGIKEAGDSSLVIMDAPPGTSCPFIQTAEQADYVVLVTEPTPFGMSDLKQSVDILKVMKKNFGVIVNRAGLGNADIFHYLAQNDIPVLQIIPFSRKIAAQYAQGKLLVENSSSWQEKFLQMFDLILTECGNSCYQR